VRLFPTEEIYFTLMVNYTQMIMSLKVIFIKKTKLEKKKKIDKRSHHEIVFVVEDGNDDDGDKN
jgi:hypothetical protein